MKNIKISIIVPVYNVEKFIRECINSLLHQDLKYSDYEIILINDGSTDKSSEICQEYVNSNSNIVLINQKNQGLSIARNTGIRCAKGEYIIFVDSDDYLKNNSLKRIYVNARDNELDILFYSFCLIKKDGTSVNRKTYSFIERNKIISGVDLFKNIDDLGSSCRSAYRREFLKKNNLMFTPKISREDCDFNLRTFPLAKTIMIIDYPIYCYRLYGESLTRTNNIEKLKHNLYSDFMIITNVTNFVRAKKVPQESIKAYKLFLNSALIGAILNVFKSRKIYGGSFTKECIDLCQKEKILPIKGRTNSWKTTLLIPFINLLFCIYKKIILINH